MKIKLYIKVRRNNRIQKIHGQIQRTKRMRQKRLIRQNECVFTISVFFKFIYFSQKFRSATIVNANEKTQTNRGDGKFSPSKNSLLFLIFLSFIQKFLAFARQSTLSTWLKKRYKNCKRKKKKLSENICKQFYVF